MPKEIAARIKKNSIPPCGLCGKKKKPRAKTDCCGNWVCGDESKYVLFSYSRDICSRNHRRFTLCGSHHAEEHTGSWKTCKKCRENFEHELEMYVWYGTNEYNFEKLENPPAFEPTHCAGCGVVIVLSEGGYSSFQGTYHCEICSEAQLAKEQATHAIQEKQKTPEEMKKERAEIARQRKDFAQTRKVLEKTIADALRQLNSGVTVEAIKKAIFREKSPGEIMKVSEMLSGGEKNSSDAAVDRALELAQAAWNHFPHKDLNGLSLMEKIWEYRLAEVEPQESAAFKKQRKRSR